MKKRTLAHENDWYYNNYIMRLLIVEDENDLRNIVKKRLVKEHYSVDACGDGLEAMDYIDMTSYDGIILDIMLPGKDGYVVFVPRFAAMNFQLIIQEHIIMRMY